MDLLLLTIKGLFFLEGLLLSKFSPRILLEGHVTPLCYVSAYITSFAVIWYTDRTRKFGPVLSTCMILSQTIKHFYGTSNYFYILFTAMIIPLTCAFTMMQCNPRQERELWALQYVWLIIGRFLRSYINILPYPLELILSTIFIILSASVPWIKRRNLTLDGYGLKGSPPPQIYTSLSKLLGQSRYLFFLFTVLIASFFFFFTKTAYNLHLVSVPLYFTFLSEILTCIVSYFLVPHRIPPQAFFLLSQFFISIRCIIFSVSGLPKSFTLPSEVLSSIGFTMMSMANAQIVATHGKPGLEFTTCAFVDICRNGIAPVLFVFISFKLYSVLLTSVLFILIFLMKYFIIDYKFDVLIKSKK